MHVCIFLIFFRKTEWVIENGIKIDIKIDCGDNDEDITDITDILDKAGNKGDKCDKEQDNEQDMDINS